MSVWLSCLVCRSVSRCLFERRPATYFVGAGRRFLVLAVLVCAVLSRAGWVCRLGAFLRHRGCCITVFISGFVVFLAPVKRCLFLAVLRGFLAF